VNSHLTSQTQALCKAAFTGRVPIIPDLVVAQIEIGEACQSTQRLSAIICDLVIFQIEIGEARQTTQRLGAPDADLIAPKPKLGEPSQSTQRLGAIIVCVR